MSESDNTNVTEQEIEKTVQTESSTQTDEGQSSKGTGPSPDTNTATATVEEPKEAPKVEEVQAPDEIKIDITESKPEEKPKKVDMPKTKTSLAKKVLDKIHPSKLKQVTYIDEKGVEHDATVTESFPIGSVYGKQAHECKEDEVIHHLEYIEDGIKKVVRSVHHIYRRPAMADGSRICVWK